MSKDRMRVSSTKRFWNAERVSELCDILKSYERVADAVEVVSKHFNHSVTSNALRMVLRDNDIKLVSVLRPPKYRNFKQVFWTEEKIITLLETFGESSTVNEALTAVTNTFESQITYDMARKALLRNNLSSKLADLVGKNAKKVVKEYKKSIKQQKMWEKKLKAKKLNKNYVKVEKKENKNLEEEIIEFILKFSKNQKRMNLKNRTKLTLTNLCNTFDCSPHRLESAIVKAKAEGYRININEDTVKINTDIISNESIVGARPKISVPKLSKNKITYAVISDTHFGSAHCLKNEIVDFINMAYDEFNVRLILHAGDMLAGNNVYRGQRFELEAWACRDQCRLCTDILPQKKDLKYVYILGNHDVDFMKSNGTDPSELIDAWRPDMTCIGNIAARFILDPYNIDIELSHIKSSAHARSWSLEKHLQKTISKHNAPDILFCGHKHTNGYFMPQNVHSCLVPCFETVNIYATYGDFYPTIGGIIVTMTLDDTGRIIRFNPMFHNYPIEFQTMVNSSEIL